MIPLIDSLQRILATGLVAGLYLLPAALGGLVTGLDVELETVTNPERMAAFVLELPKGASIPMLLEDEEPEPEKKPEKKAQPSTDKTRLTAPGGVPIATGEPEQLRKAERKERGKARGEGEHKGRKQQCMASTGQVTSTGADSYRIERAMLDYYFGHTDDAAKLGSAAWYRDESGDISGIRLRSVRCGSPVEEAGLKRGDITKAANGKRVDSLAGVIALWWQLRSKDDVKLIVIRDGQRKRLSYSLV
jgi:hypothetical protein